MTKRKLRKELSELARKSEVVATLYSGSLGIYIGGTQYVDVPNRPGFVYVRLRNNISELIQAHNEVVSPVYGLPVLLIRNKTYYEIYGRDSVQYGSYWDSNSSYLPKHGHQHEFDPDNNGGGDLVFVHGEQFYPMMTFPSGSDGGNTVLIAPYRYFYRSQWYYTGNTGVGDLLQYGPTGANNAKLLLVGTTSATGNPFVKQGSEFSEGITGAAALTQFVPTNITPIDEIPGAIIRLVTGTQTITWANIYDARQYMGILQAGSGTSGGATDFLGLTDTPNSYAGQADKLVVVNAAANALEFRTNTGTSSGGTADAIILDTFFASYPLASGNNNNYNPSGYASDTNIIIVYGNSDGTSVITGLAGGRNGREVTIHNSEYKVNLAHLSGASDVDKVFVFNTTDGITLGENESITLYYDTGWNRWFALEDRRERDVTIVPPGYAYLITGSINDWSDYRLYKNTIFTLNPTGNYNITGLYPFNNNQELTFINIGTGTVVTFQNEATGSTASYRLSMGSDNALGPGKSITLWYDAVSTRWRALDFTATGSFGGGGGTTLGLGFYGQDEAVGLGTGTTLNVVGNDISLSISGTVLTLLHSDPTGTPHSFLDLTDTPDSYSSQGSKFVAVNAGATALEFVAAPAGGGGSGSGLVVYDDSVYKVTGTAISFDSNLSVTVTGSVAYVSTSLAFGTSSRTAGDLTTTSTSFVDADATNLKVTITTSARRCLVLVNVMIFNSGANTTALDLDIDGVRQGDTLGLSFMNGTNPVPGSFEFITGVLSAASHTFKLQWKVSAGTGTMFANTTTARATISVEELPLIS